MPLDAEPSPKGTWRLEETPSGKILGVYVRKADASAVGLFAEEPLYVSHWANCHGAQQARIDADAKKGPPR
jgi:hypothetical protein